MHTGNMKEEYRKWYSLHTGRDFELLVFGHGGIPLILFPSSMGRYYEAKDFGLIGSVSWFIEQGRVRIYCVDSADAWSWYNKSVHPAERAANHVCYDRLILEEVCGMARQETGLDRIAVAGCSFGGYHAVNFAFRHPWMVSHVFSMSGAFDIRGQMDGFYNDEVYFNNPVDFIPDDRNPELWRLRIILGTSDRDICRGDNERMSAILSAKGIGHWLDLRSNADHDWPVWREMLPHYLSEL